MARPPSGSNGLYTCSHCRRSAVPERTGERWSQRRKRIQDSAKAKEEEEKPKLEMPELKPVEEPVKVADVVPVAAPSLSPQIKRTRPPRKKKRGWVKGRSRQKPMKQLTLPELVKAKQESETESVLSEEEAAKRVTSANHNNEVREPKTKSKEEMKRPPRISTEEDSSAEADDEMENDELGTKESPAKYKYPTPEPPKKTEVVEEPVKEKPAEAKEKIEETSEKVIETVNEPQPAPQPEKKEEPEVKEVPEEKPVVIEDTTSESETEIDGHKIKSISHKEILEISKQNPTLNTPVQAPAEEKTTRQEAIEEKVEQNNKPIEEPATVVAPVVPEKEPEKVKTPEPAIEETEKVGGSFFLLA